MMSVNFVLHPTKDKGDEYWSDSKFPSPWKMELNGSGECTLTFTIPYDTIDVYDVEHITGIFHNECFDLSKHILLRTYISSD